MEPAANTVPKPRHVLSPESHLLHAVIYLLKLRFAQDLSLPKSLVYCIQDTHEVLSEDLEGNLVPLCLVPNLSLSLYLSIKMQKLLSSLIITIQQLFLIIRDILLISDVTLDLMFDCVVKLGELWKDDLRGLVVWRALCHVFIQWLAFALLIILVIVIVFVVAEVFGVFDLCL